MDSPNIYSGYEVIKRGGKQTVPFDPFKITVAVKKAFLAAFPDEAGQRMVDLSANVTESVVNALTRNKARTQFHVEDVQDMVELDLMRRGEREVARAYVLYREQHAAQRAPAPEAELFVVIKGVRQPFNEAKLVAALQKACEGLDVDLAPIAARTKREIFDGATEVDIEKAAGLAARTFIEQDPIFNKVAARLELTNIYDEVLGESVPREERAQALRAAFPKLIKQGVEYGLFTDKLLQYDMVKLANALDLSRDNQFRLLGVTTLYNSYLVHVQERRIEVPQTLFMRIAMGLALGEIEREERAIEFYNVLSQFDYMASTPTLFNAGLVRSQMSSCFLTTVGDDLTSIYEDGMKQNALLQKYAGGLGNDWTNVRALGAYIKGTNGKSQGVLPFLKVVNDTAVAVNQGGKRKGAVCAYLETWHLDIEDFLEARKNTGDDRRRLHDMNTANWVPDLFMKRVHEEGQWTLFSPSDAPDLHDLYGRAFEKRYHEYEALVASGAIKHFKVVEAKALWRRMLSMLFETGHPWITFKDACNVRSPQQHVGVVHSSNLCTEITLNTSLEETAVCNIGSVNLVNHIKEGKLDASKLRRTVRTAMRMLDNVIDLNYYTVAKARRANMRHRPVGLGMMGFADVLQEMRIPFASKEAVEFADMSGEALCYFAYEASSDLAAERGRYSSYEGSLWSQGKLPQDTNAMLAKERGGYLEVDNSSHLGEEFWDKLRRKIAVQGMRNSNCVAVAPTATISNIVGVSATIEPIYGNLSVKSNLSGDFTVLNERMVNDLKSRGLWDAVMLSDLKHYNGSLKPISRVPQELQELYATAFEVDAVWLIEGGSRRQKWIDQAQSLNIYLKDATGPMIDAVYKLAWLRGLKTTYYLRTLGASSAEKSTGRGNELNAVSAHVEGASAAAATPAAPAAVPAVAPVVAPVVAPTAALVAVPVATAVAAPAMVVTGDSFELGDQPEGSFCTLRPGDEGFDSCAACQ